jgi:putative ABC transport system permease protein
MLAENIKIALKALWANKMRSILTTLGIIIGVASVIAVVSLVQGMNHSLAAEFESIGATFLIVVPDPGEDRRSMAPKMPDLTYEDGLAVMRSAPAVRQFNPLFYTMVEAKYRDTRHRPDYLLGVNDSYQDVVNHWVDRGRFFVPLDLEAKKKVCAIGYEVARKLGISAEPLGKVIQLNGVSFTVIGVMEKKGSMLGEDRDDIVLIPFSTAGLLYGAEAMRSIRLDFKAAQANQTDLAREQIRQILRTRHRLKEGKPDDFRIILQEEIVKGVSKALTMTSLIMGAIVGIALLVGGIGIMNIMLVSVTERTREIGIRKAVGARRGDVLSQFLIEAITLSGLGGLVGIISGFLLATAVRAILARWIEFPRVYTPIWAILLAFGFSAFLGIVFGTYPAAKASKLDPIESLRYE